MRNMKLFRNILFTGLALASVACRGPVQDNNNIDPRFRDDFPSRALIDSVSYLLGANLGATVRQNGFEHLDLDRLIDGLCDVIRSPKELSDPGFNASLAMNPESTMRVLEDYYEQLGAYTAAVNGANSEAFLAGNAAKPDIQTSPSGLQYIIYDAGNGRRVASDKDVIVVNYKGSTFEGKTFDEGERAEFIPEKLIAGMAEGLRLVGEGGRMRLFIPAALAYGEKGTRLIEPNMALIYDVELLEIHYADKEAANEVW